MGRNDDRLKKAVNVPNRERTEHSRMTKSALWKEYFKMNRLKAEVMLMRNKRGKQWEKKWAKFVKSEWDNPKNSVDWEAKCLVYSGIRAYSRAEYIEETSMGLTKRVIAHIKKVANGKSRQKVYKCMGRLGIHKMVWFPVWCWRRNNTRKTSMRKEEESIWTGDPMLNTLGTERPSDRMRAGGRDDHRAETESTPDGQNNADTPNRYALRP